MAYTAYTLPNLVTVSGTFKVKLYSGIVDLEIPADQTILEIADLVEMVDVSPSVSELSTLKLKLVRDDYGTYANGFWHQVLTDTTEEPQIRIYLDEDGVTDTYFFWGQIQRSESTAIEYYVDSTPTFIRAFEVTLVSLAFKMREVLISDVLDEIVTADPTYLVATEKVDITEPTKVCRVIDIFNAFLAVAFGQTFSSTLAEWVYDGTNEDFLYYDGANWLSFDDTYIAVYESDGVGGEDLTTYFDPIEADYIPTLYGETADDPKGFEFFVDCLRNFGFAFRHLYGNSDGTIDGTPANNFHRIHLLQRGRTFSGVVTFNAPKKSSIDLSRDFISKGVRVFAKAATINFASVWRGGPGSVSFAAPPPNVNFDLDIAALWFVDSSLPGQLFTIAGNPFTSIKYYHYSISILVEATGTYRHMQALAMYYYMRYFTDKKIYNRIYGRMEATDGAVTSHRSIIPLKRHTIADGAATPTFYANKVVKNPKSSEVSVEWIQE